MVGLMAMGSAGEDLRWALAISYSLDAFERQASGQQLIESDADGVDIRARVELFAENLFGRHEGQGAQDHADRVFSGPRVGNARPKSRSLTRSSGLIMMLDGLTSR